MGRCALMDPPYAFGLAFNVHILCTNAFAGTCQLCWSGCDRSGCYALVSPHSTPERSIQTGCRLDMDWGLLREVMMCMCRRQRMHCKESGHCQQAQEAGRLP